MNQRLAARYEQARQDAYLVNLNEEIALVDARLYDLLDRISGTVNGDGSSNKDGSARAWTRLEQSYAELRRALQTGDNAWILGVINRIGTIIEDGAQERDIWAEVHRVIEQRRRLVDSEFRRMVSMGAMMTSEQAVVLVSAVTAIVQKYVRDPNERRAAAYELIRLVSAGNSQQPQP